ncbi:MAG: PD40 domain-containing protein [Bacteroidetes bacterium]|nr:PD40 domain-containing protein [Bacteroidota bacterium]
MPHWYHRSIAYAVIAQIVLLLSLSRELRAQVSTDTPDTSKAYNLGRAVNSSRDESFPYIATGNTILYFTSRRLTNSDLQTDRCYFSTRNTDSTGGEWSAPKLLEAFHSALSASGSICFDASGRVYFASAERNPERNYVSIYEGRFDSAGELQIRDLGAPVNGHSWNSQMSVTSDGNTMYFASDRTSPDGARSGMRIPHIWVTHRTSESTWSTPTMLGEHVNRTNYTATPWISPNGKVLLFASQGNTVLRTLRIYYCKKVGPGDDDWSERIALPAPINAENNSLCPMVAADGHTIYFASDRSGGYGGLDLYKTQLPKRVLDDIGTAFAR